MNADTLFTIASKNHSIMFWARKKDEGNIIPSDIKELSYDSLYPFFVILLLVFIPIYELCPNFSIFFSSLFCLLLKPFHYSLWNRGNVSTPENILLNGKTFLYTDFKDFFVSLQNVYILKITQNKKYLFVFKTILRWCYNFISHITILTPRNILRPPAHYVYF